MVSGYEQVYRIKVSLKGSDPFVWRRVLVPGNVSLSRLHLILQALMGWENYHLHMFKIQGEIYGDPEDDEYSDLGTKDEHEYRLEQLVKKPGTAFEYEYDFGDSWIHELEVEEIFPLEASSPVPRCIEGQRAGPPEDVGGIGGYYQYVKAIKNRRHPEHQEWLAWRGPFDPEKFDLQAINARLFWLSNEERAQKLGLNRIEELDLAYFYYPSLTRWAQGLDDEQYSTAGELPLRRDMLVLLTYLRDNKVTGTQAAGNLPLKAAKEISARFVQPPVWEEVIGEYVFRVRSSGDIWPIYFLMVLAQVGQLLEGGSSRRFRLTPDGAEFLAASAPLQVWYLLAVWWTRVNWLIAFPLKGMGDRLPYNFAETVGNHLLKQPAGEPVPFTPFADRLIEQAGLVWSSQDQTYAHRTLRSSINRMVIAQLSDFGVLSPEYQTSSGQAGIVLKEPAAFQITRFGRNLLESLAYPGRWVDSD